MLTLGRDFENFGSDNIWIWHSGWRLQQRSCALLSPFTVKVKRIKNREKNDTSAIKVCNNGSRDRHHHGSSQQAVCFTAQFDQRDPRVGKGNEYCYFQPDQQGDHAFQRGRCLLGYARQVLEQAAILEDKYKGNPGGKNSSAYPPSIIPLPSTHSWT